MARTAALSVFTAFVLFHTPVIALAQQAASQNSQNGSIGHRFYQKAKTSPIRPAERSGFTDLLPYALPAPDQLDAGSCLYMSLTGAAEWWLAKLNPFTPRESDGPLDLSERWVMNAAGDSRAMTGIQNWKTDSVYIFNNIREVALNTAYRFTMGWFTASNGKYLPSREGASGAKYSELYNRIDERTHAGPERAELPKFERTIIFAGKGATPWDVGIAPDDLVQKIKWALMRSRAPVQVIYNDQGYWHALLILGFDDRQPTEGCKFIEASRAYFKTKESLAKDGSAGAALEGSIKRRGACNPEGVFFVRDSVYGDKSQPEYNYDPTEEDRGKGRYSAKIVGLEFAFVTHLANHAIQITAQQ